MKPIFANLKLAGGRRRRRGFNWWRMLAFLGLTALFGWMLCGCEAQAAAEQAGSLSHGAETVPPWLSGALMGLLFACTVAMVWMAVRKQESVDLDALVGEPVGRWEGGTVGQWDSGTVGLSHADVRAVVVTCAAEARCVEKHVRRAQRTLRIEDYEDELALAARKVEALISRMESLLARLGKEDEQEQAGSLSHDSSHVPFEGEGVAA